MVPHKTEMVRIRQGDKKKIFLFVEIPRGTQSFQGEGGGGANAPQMKPLVRVGLYSRVGLYEGWAYTRSGLNYTWGGLINRSGHFHSANHHTPL